MADHRGIVLSFNAETGEGLISTEGGERLTFGRLDWAGEGEPTGGAQVDFVRQDTAARQIYPIVAAATEAQQPIAATVLPDQSAAHTGSKRQAWFARLHVIGAAAALVGFFVGGLHMLLPEALEAQEDVSRAARLGAAFATSSTGATTLLVMWGAMVYYFIPLFASILILRSTQDKESGWIMRQTAFSAIGIPLIYPVISYFAITGAMDEDLDGMGGFVRQQASWTDAYEINTSFVLMVGGGVLILIAGVIGLHRPRNANV